MIRFVTYLQCYTKNLVGTPGQPAQSLLRCSVPMTMRKICVKTPDTKRGLMSQ